MKKWKRVFGEKKHGRRRRFEQKDEGAQLRWTGKKIRAVRSRRGLRRSSWTPLFYSRGDTGREVHPSGACQRNLVTKWFSVEVQYGISYWVAHKYHVYEETVSLTTGAKVILTSCKWTFPGGRPRSSPRSMRTTEGPSMTMTETR